MQTVGQVRIYIQTCLIRVVAKSIVNLTMEYERAFEDGDLDPQAQATILMTISNEMRIQARDLVAKLGEYERLNAVMRE